ncbi:MAG: NADPH:quinone reductase [Candidatus Hydrogenedentota bacterium]
MKAVVYTRYGPPEVLEVKDVPTPAPRENEVRIRVHAASVNAGDWRLMRGEPFLVRLMSGIRKPKFSILGSDLAGTIDQTGPKATKFRPGDAVFGEMSTCGFGSFAEFACVPQDMLVSKPANLTLEEAAAVPTAGLTALQAVRDHGKAAAGQSVMVVGASGGVGSFAVQIAKALGATVTGVCSARKVDWVRAIGADDVVDYATTDFTRQRERYDLIVDAGAYRPITHYRRILKPGGRYVMVGGSLRAFLSASLLGPAYSTLGNVTMQSMLVKPNAADLESLKTLLESGQIRPVVDRVGELNDVPDAIRQMEAGHIRGKVVIRVAA